MSKSPTWRRMTAEEVAASDASPPIPVSCETCHDSDYVLGDSIFVNTEHNYGVEYIGAPCPDCNPNGER